MFQTENWTWRETESEKTKLNYHLYILGIGIGLVELRPTLEFAMTSCRFPKYFACGAFRGTRWEELEGGTGWEELEGGMAGEDLEAGATGTATGSDGSADWTVMLPIMAVIVIVSNSILSKILKAIQLKINRPHGEFQLISPCTVIDLLLKWIFMVLNRSFGKTCPLYF